MDAMAEKLEAVEGEKRRAPTPCTGYVPTVSDLLAQLQSAPWLKDLTVVIKTPDGTFHKDVWVGFGHRGGDPCGKCVILGW
jgi:hypothetical protein